MMTYAGYPWTVQHDTNYVVWAGNVGGVMQMWHVEYGEKCSTIPNDPKDIDVEPEWDCKHYCYTETEEIIKDGEIQYKSEPCGTSKQKKINHTGDKNKC